MFYSQILSDIYNNKFFVKCSIVHQTSWTPQYMRSYTSIHIYCYWCLCMVYQLILSTRILSDIVLCVCFLFMLFMAKAGMDKVLNFKLWKLIKIFVLHSFSGSQSPHILPHLKREIIWFGESLAWCRINKGTHA